jgi:hypothetical protein
MLQTVRNQLIAISFAALLFLSLVLALVFFADPYQASLLVIVIFYVCIIGFSLNFFTLLIYAIRSRFADGLHFKKISIAMREAALLTILVVGLLFLSSQHLFYWWVVGSLVLALIFIEGYFLI